MTRQQLNEAFALTSFLHGANVAYIEEMHGRYQENPGSVSEQWRSFFAAMQDDPKYATAQAEGPSWSRPAIAAERSGNTELVAALTNDWGSIEKEVSHQDRAGQPPGRHERLGRGHTARHAGLDPRLHADPRLPHPRPSRRRSRSARAGRAQGASRAQARDLRLHRRRHGPADLPRSGARPRSRDHARDHQDPETHVLQPDRLRVHAHHLAAAARLGAKAHRGPAQRGALHAGRAPRHPQQADRGRELREVLRYQVHRHQALWPRRQRVRRSPRSSRSSSAAASSA